MNAAIGLSKSQKKEPLPVEGKGANERRGYEE
jgi:hypothetical protein